MSELRVGANIAVRLSELAKLGIAVASSLPKTTIGTHVAKQLVRSVTAVGANYEEARAAESRADFIHKLGLAVKEARETIYWLELVRADAKIDPLTLARAIDESNQLAAVLFASRRTALKNASHTRSG
jgi:four helix bundle protein